MRVSPAKKKQYYISKANRNSDLTPRAKGKKSRRRLENTLYLANLLAKVECCEEELMAGSHPAIPSIFTEVSTNENYAEQWDDFMNRSGEEQERLLALLEEEAKKKTGGRAERMSAPACFLRIDRRLRCSLRRKQIPMGTLEVLEEGVLDFFNAQPHAIYTVKLASSFERLLLHAVCQYMDLVSASSNCKGARQTEVVNKQEDFQPPCSLLSAYLE
ncbi:hypothetical protein CRUP_012201, partial [Coryphaenoides rupestris]